MTSTYGCSRLLFFWSQNSVSKKYKGSRDVDSLDRFMRDMVEAGFPPESVSFKL